MLARALGLVGRAAGAAAAAGPSTATQAVCVALGQAAFGFGAGRGFATNSTDVFNVHKDTPENNLTTKFDFTPVRGHCLRVQGAVWGSALPFCFRCWCGATGARGPSSGVGRGPAPLPVSAAQSPFAPEPAACVPGQPACALWPRACV